MCKSILKITVFISAMIVLCGKADAQSGYQLAEQDSLALVAFYWATDGPNWTSNQEGFDKSVLSSEWQDFYDGGYNTWFDGPVKDWFGVRVEKRPIENSTDSIDRVTWLWPVIGRRTDGQNQLSGYVPREIGFLTALEQFRVNGNDGFTEELIPDELYHKTLRHFDTESAWFGGGLSQALRNCTDIRKFNVRYNLYDHMPNLDFLDEQGVRNLEGTQWFYNSRFSYFYMERIVEYFYTISDTPMEFGIEARDMFDVGDEIEIVAPLGSSVEMICNDAGTKEEFITYQWFKDGLSKFGKKNKNYTIASVSASDYGHYTTRITNDYVKNYDSNGNYGEVFTKGIHLVETPTAPVITKSVVENNGQIIDLYFSKTMTGAQGFESLQVKAEGEEVAILSAVITGRLDRQVRIVLEDAVKTGELITLSYAGSEIKDKNGGLLEAINEMEIENRTRRAPSPVEAQTTLDGTGILVFFDQFIDETSFDEADFVIMGNQTYTISDLTLQPGPINQNISKTLLISVQEAISDTSEVITVSYLDGKVHGLYSGTVDPFENLSVLNQVTVDRSEVTLLFEDGSEQLDQVVIAGSWRLNKLEMNDSGIEGDEVAGDHVWTYKTALPDETYTWDVFARSSEVVFDTIVSVDTLGNTVLTLVENEKNIDSLLSSQFILEFQLDQRSVTGDTIFGIQNRDIIFNLKVNANNEEIYLMGINNDWTNGILMDKVSDDVYTYTLPRKTAGDLINYNYRRGDSFENQTPETRSYTVLNAYNEINDEFGIFTSLVEHEDRNFTIFPNPTFNGIVSIRAEKDLDQMEIYNQLGQLIRAQNIRQTNKLDLSDLSKGLYFLKGSISGQYTNTFKLLIH